MLLAHPITESLFFCIGQVIICLVDGFQQLAILVALEEGLNRQHEQVTSGDLQFLGQGINLLKEGPLQRDSCFHIYHWFIPSRATSDLLILYEKGFWQAAGRLPETPVLICDLFRDAADDPFDQPVEGQLFLVGYGHSKGN